MDEFFPFTTLSPETLRGWLFQALAAGVVIGAVIVLAVEAAASLFGD